MAHASPSSAASTRFDLTTSRSPCASCATSPLTQRPPDERSADVASPCRRARSAHAGSLERDHVTALPAFASRRRPPASSTWAARARRCSTGRSPTSTGGTFVLRIEDTDEARNRPGVDAGHHRRAGLDRHPRRRPALRGPVLPERVRRAARRRRAAAVRGGPRLLLRHDARRDRRARNKAEGNQGYEGWSRDRGLGPGPGPRAALPGARGHHGRARPGPRRGRRSTTRTIEDFVLLRGNGTPMFLLANVVDDMAMASPTSCAPRSTCRTRPSSSCSGRRSAPRAAGVGARAGAGERAAQEAVEAARQGGARAVPRRGLPGRRRWSTT